LLVERLPEAPADVLDAARQLTFRNTIIVYLEVADSNVCPDQWIYIHSPELRTGRITNFRNWVPQLYGESPGTILAMEYWCDEPEVGGQKAEGGHRLEPPYVGCYEGEDLWRRSDEKLIALARRELVGTTLVRDESLILNGKVLRIPRCYPVYRRGYKELLRPIQEYLSSIRGLQVIGRYGSFKYNNQDHSILMGILAAENILNNAGHDLWSVNADYDTYQEGCRITETGLVPA
jgi:protoporphyrinogen oxidase